MDLGLKTKLTIISIVAVIFIAIASFYKVFVADMWGDIFHVPWNVWIAWTFWAVLGILILLIGAVFLFLGLAFSQSNGKEPLEHQPKRKTRSRTNNKQKKKQKTKQKKRHPHKEKNKQKTQEPQEKVYFVNGKPEGKEKVPEHPPAWDEEEFE